MSTSIIGGCSRQARIAAEALPLYRRGAEALAIERTIARNDAERRMGIRMIAADLGISLAEAEALYEMSGRRSAGVAE